MYYLNLNKKTNRVLSASLLFNETSIINVICLNISRYYLIRKKR